MDARLLQENTIEAASQCLGAWPELTPGSNNSFIHDFSGITHWEECTHRQKVILELGLVRYTYETNAAIVFPGLDFCEQLLCRWK